jgi:16S rRNA (guanine(966)-N(2))-methyltransferase RsmD
MSLGPLDGQRVVDLYAGSGALAIEALSRGAEHADLVEVDRSARETIARNVQELGLTARVRVWPLKLPAGYPRLAAVLAAAGVVFADPPYGGREARETLAALGRAGVLRAGTRFVLETHGKDEVPDADGVLARERERRYGETVVHVYRAAAAPTEGPQHE